MAIKLRRGAVADFDKSKMVEGEVAITREGEAYYCYMAGQVKKFATVEDLLKILNVTEEELQWIHDLLENEEQVMAIIQEINEVGQSNLNNIVNTANTKINEMNSIKTQTETIKNQAQTSATEAEQSAREAEAASIISDTSKIFKQVSGRGVYNTLEPVGDYGKTSKLRIEGNTVITDGVMESVTGDVVVKSVGKNLFDGKLEMGEINSTTGALSGSTQVLRSTNFTKVKPNTNYRLSLNGQTGVNIRRYDANYNYLGLGVGVFATDDVTHYIKFRFTSTDLSLPFMIEEGTSVTEYEPYQSDEITYQVDLRSTIDGTVRDYIENGYLHQLVDENSEPLAEPIIVDLNMSKTWLETYEGQTNVYSEGSNVQPIIDVSAVEVYNPDVLDMIRSELQKL